MGAIMAVRSRASRTATCWSTFATNCARTATVRAAAAIEAGRIRFRPIIMTAMAMILGMLPMALSLGSGSEQNAAARPRSLLAVWSRRH